MEILQSIVLGIIQGLGEFLPISSSGHLVVLPKIFGWDDQGLAFDVALHFGTLLAILIYFYEDWKRIISKSYFLKQTGRIFIDRDREFFKINKLKEDTLVIIGIATIPGVLAGLLLEDYAATIFRNPILVGFTLLFGAMILFYADKAGKKKLDTKDITLKIAFIIGLFQMLAVVPGMSRSGMTISAALLLGLNRTSAARFSFLLATPIVLGATIKEYSTFMAAGWDINLLVGVLAAFGSGYLAIKYMLKYLEKQSYNIFVIYRIALALVIFLLFY
ncbi:MAG: undecaprenyl-diphosphatase UppP [Candidatus Pacebacteria bacterium]|nr:undecaprenyl-diphosphatase UppP [Candidatus Paceibacterota bacterium]